MRANSDRPLILSWGSVDSGHLVFPEILARASRPSILPVELRGYHRLRPGRLRLSLGSFRRRNGFCGSCGICPRCDFVVQSSTCWCRISFSVRFARDKMCWRRTVWQKSKASAKLVFPSFSATADGVIPACSGHALNCRSRKCSSLSLEGCGISSLS